MYTLWQIETVVLILIYVSWEAVLSVPAVIERQQEQGKKWSESRKKVIQVYIVKALHPFRVPLIKFLWI